MQHTAGGGSSKQGVHSVILELTGESEHTAPSQTLSPLGPSATRTTPLSHNTNWIKTLSEKLKVTRKKDVKPVGKVSRVDTPDLELKDVEYFRACLHYFEWTMPPRAQLRKCFTAGFSKALLRNVSPINRSGQCFLAFVIHEAKRFLENENVRTNTVNLEHCLRAILHTDVASLITQTIGAQQLHLGRDLSRTQCLHDRSFPDWISFIAEHVILSPLLSTKARKCLSVLLSTLDLHASIRLSDGARQKLAPGPWSKKYMKIARKMARRRSPRSSVMRTQSPNPFTAPPTVTSASHNRSLSNIAAPNDDNQDGSSAIFNPDVAQQHLESLQSSNEPTRQTQVFRNGVPHSLYATETMLQSDLRDLESRLLEQQSYLRIVSTAPPNLAVAGSGASRSSENHTCLVGFMLRRKRSFVHACGRGKSGAKSQPQSQNRITRHEGSPAEQEHALKDLRDRILVLQRHKRFCEDDLEWRQGHQPREATVGVPSRRGPRRAWKADSARSQDSRPRGLFRSMRGGASREPSRDTSRGGSRDLSRDLTPEPSQRRDLGPIRIPSDDPPTYTQSELERQRWRDRVSPSRLQRWSGGLKRLLRRMGLKNSEDKDVAALRIRDPSRSPRSPQA